MLHMLTDELLEGVPEYISRCAGLKRGDCGLSPHRLRLEIHSQATKKENRWHRSLSVAWDEASKWCGKLRHSSRNSAIAIQPKCLSRLFLSGVPKMDFGFLVFFSGMPELQKRCPV